MNSDRRQFFEFRRLRKPIFVGGISRGLPAVEVGKVRIADDRGRTRVLNNVLYIPKLKNNLLSITKATLDGWRSVFENGGCTTTHGDDFRIYTPIQDGLCIFTSVPSVMQALVAAASTGPRDRTVTITDWHDRLGHVSKTAILKLGDRVVGLNLGPTDPEEFPGCQCGPCATGKQHRLPFEAVEVRADKPLELVHSDLCGEFPMKSLGGGRYFMTFTDDCTRYCRVYILKNKEATSILGAFEEYRAWAEKQTGFEIKTIRTHGGKEYHGEMETNLKGTGIENQSTAAYSSQSNGVSERMNRTLMDMVRPMLEGSGAPSMLWGEAVITACYIKNRLPSRALKDGRTPHEAWTGEKPYLGHIKKFGCAVYAYVPKKLRKKLDPKPTKRILVGYESESGLYRVYHPQKSKVVTSRDLIICEDEFPYGNRVPTFIPERNDGEIFDTITPVSDPVPVVNVDVTEFVELPTPPPTPAVTPIAVTPAPVPSPSPRSKKQHQSTTRL
jgi:Pol polyprotein, beta-barrel domain